MVGDKAKEFIMNKVISALSDNYLGTQDKKYYFKSKENGESKVVCLSITCPKVIPEFAATTTAAPTGDFDWGEPTSTASILVPPSKAATEITEDEINNVKAMLEKLGL